MFIVSNSIINTNETTFILNLLLKNTKCEYANYILLFSIVTLSFHVSIAFSCFKSKMVHTESSPSNLIKHTIE